MVTCIERFISQNTVFIVDSIAIKRGHFALMQVIKASSATDLQAQTQGSSQQGISFLQQFLQSGIRQNLTEVTSIYSDKVKGMGYISVLQLLLTSTLSGPVGYG